jgi:hypothetical protein
MNRPRLAIAALAAVLVSLSIAASAAPAATVVDARLAGHPVVHGSLISVPAILTPASARRAGVASPVVTIVAPRINGVRTLRPGRLRIGDVLRATSASRSGESRIRATRLSVRRRGRAASYEEIGRLVASARVAAKAAGVSAAQVAALEPGGSVPVAQVDQVRTATQALRVKVGYLRDRVDSLRASFARSAAGAQLDLSGLAKSSGAAARRRSALVGPLARSRDALAAAVAALDKAVTQLDEMIIDLPSAHPGPTDGIVLPVDGVGTANEAIVAVEKLLGALDGPG